MNTPPFQGLVLELRRSVASERARQSVKPQGLGLGGQSGYGSWQEYTLSESVQREMELLQQRVEQDVNRYFLAEKEKKTVAEGGVEEAEEAAPQVPQEALEDGTFSLFGAGMADRWCPPLAGRDGKELGKEKMDAALAGLNAAERLLYVTMQDESDFMTANMLELRCSTAALQKVGRAVQAISGHRIGDAITLLKSARQDEPNNRSISFLLGQVYYFQAFQGVGDCLPKARDEAKRCAAFSEKFPAERLLYYRYTVTAQERYFSPARALECMREYGLLKLEPLLSSDVSQTTKSLTLKAWLLLSIIPIENWEKREVDGFVGFVEKIVGAVPLYLYFFRERLFTESEKKHGSKIAALNEVEAHVARLSGAYHVLRETVAENVTEEGKLKRAVSLPWTVRSRYLQLFLGTAPFPMFDEVALHINLEGTAYDAIGYPSQQLKENGLAETDYWAAWAQGLTAGSLAQESGKEGVPSLLPIRAVLLEIPLLSKYEQLLQMLRNEEKDLLATVDIGLWEKIQPYLMAYHYETLLELGTGRGARFFHGSEPEAFQGYIRDWGSSTPRSFFPSEMITHHAAQAGFWDIQEVQYVFDGVLKLWEDETYGPKARLKAALEHYEREKAESEKQNRKRTALGGYEEHLEAYWWVYGIVAMAVCTFFTVLLLNG